MKSRWRSPDGGSYVARNTKIESCGAVLCAWWGTGSTPMRSFHTVSPRTPVNRVKKHRIHLILALGTFRLAPLKNPPTYSRTIELPLLLFLFVVLAAFLIALSTLEGGSSSCEERESAAPPPTCAAAC